MKPVLLDIEEFTKDLPEITTWKVLEGRKKIAKSGLFSLQIFGPTTSWKCDCPRSIYRGPTKDATKCNVCGVDITTSEVRRKRFAKIVLPFPILNPLFYYLIVNSKPSLKQTINNIIFFKNKYAMNKKNGFMRKILTSDEVTSDEVYIYGLPGLKLFLSKLCEKTKIKNLLFIKNNMEKLELKTIIVIPPDFRNYSGNKESTLLMDSINRYYKLLIKRVEKLKKMAYTPNEDHEVYRTYFRSIQLHVNMIYGYIFERLSKKSGLIRKNILGKRIDFSGRAVITPDPTLDLDYCKIPYVVLLEIFKPYLTSYFIDRKIFKRYNIAVEEIDSCIQKNDPKLFNYVKDFCKNKLCVINRQPTLHRMSMFAFYIIPTLDFTLKIHPLICHPLNADFDGDQMSIYVLMNKECEEDVYNKIGIWNNLISPTDASYITKGNQDIILGIYELTR